MREGKNREIRNICSYFNWKIVKLLRVSFGPYKLGSLKVGKLEKIKVINNDKITVVNSKEKSLNQFLNL